MNKRLKTMSLTALFAALILVSTAYAKIPIGFGYVHVGDIFIMTGAFFLPPVYAVLSAAIGSMLADLIAGYVIYMPVTFFVKGLMALLCSLLYYRKFKFVRLLAGTVAASVAMLVGYFVFEGFYYGWAGAIGNIPLSLIQPAVSVPCAVLLTPALGKIPYLINLKEEIMPRKKVSTKAHAPAEKASDSDVEDAGASD